MEAGRKKGAVIINERKVASPTGELYVNVRLLRKSDLGGVIFGCKNYTMAECLRKQLFGLPAPHFQYVKNIEAGLPLFLFNYTDRMLHGVYESASSGQMNIDPYGWTDRGSDRTQFPAQVRICQRFRCQPLHEEKFRPIISDNYYTQTHFWFELDHAQVDRLLLLFVPSTGKPQTSSKWKTLANVAPATKILQTNKYEWLNWDGLTEISGGSSKASSIDDVDYNPPGTEPDVRDSDLQMVHKVAETSGTIPCHEERRQTLHSAPHLIEEKADEQSVLLKLKELALNRNLSTLDNMPVVQSEDATGLDGAADLQQSDKQNQDNQAISAEQLDSQVPTHPQVDITQLRQSIEDLRLVVQEQGQVIKAMEEKQAASDKVIQNLNGRIYSMEIKLDPQRHLYSDMIFLLGGYDGTSLLSALDAYSPSKDLVASLKPMSSIRSYASAAVLNGEIYVFGGGNGTTWYDTVERYMPKDDQWTICPPLSTKKGSLAGVTLHDKIFAVGGGDGIECFSDVEVFDPALGRWIQVHPLLEKRFAPAAAELDGVLYVVGGFDGKGYLKSAERFDPREPVCTRLPNMNIRRGCHSVSSLNGKIYAFGGYDGSGMVSLVEVFDPRSGSWMAGEPMKCCRGYTAAVVLRDVVYVIGGVRDGANILDSVECYREGRGWESTGSKAVGKRCFSAAVVL